MELDSLKEIWKEAEGKNSSPAASEEIMAMLNKSSNSPIARMMRNVLIEMILVIVLFGFVTIYYFIAFNGKFSSIGWVYTILAALCTFYYYRKWKLLQSMQCIACQVKSNLARQVKTLEKYVRFYFLSGTAMIPLVFIFMGLLFYYEFPVGSLKPIFPPSGDINSTTWIGWVLSLILLTILAYWGNKWYVKRLYGQHIQQLKQLLAQMEE